MPRASCLSIHSNLDTALCYLHHKRFLTFFRTLHSTSPLQVVYAGVDGASHNQGYLAVEPVILHEKSARTILVPMNALELPRDTCMDTWFHSPSTPESHIACGAAENVPSPMLDNPILKGLDARQNPTLLFHHFFTSNFFP